MWTALRSSFTLSHGGNSVYDGSARLRERATGREVYRVRGHRDFVWAANFSPDE